MTLKVYNRFTGNKEDFQTVKEGRVGIYFCGLTVQGKPHMGHMMAFVAGDLIRRYLRFKGYEVKYIQNFTDIDDKIIAKANREGADYLDLAERNIQEYFKCAELLNILPADVYPRATEHIADIIDLVKRLQEKGFAYEAGGDVYFRVRKFADYGKLSGRKIDDLQVGARIAAGEHKEDPLDFTLWKAAKEGEPSWDSPWSRGRPGWHIECSVMSMKYLGETLDMHGGGEDLIFPHHENEIAQSEAATGKRFVNYWMHNGLLNLRGEKMSKSTDHFFSIDQVREDFTGGEIRFYLLSTHFRSRSEFNRERMEEARAGLERIRKFCGYLDECSAESKTDDTGSGRHEAMEGLIGDARDNFIAAMDDDFNSAEAIGHIFNLVRESNRIFREPGFDLAGYSKTLQTALETMRMFNDILGLFGEGLPVEEEEEISEEVMELVRNREEARRNRDWESADTIRDRLAGMGYVIEDNPEGPRVRKAGKG